MTTRMPVPLSTAVAAPAASFMLSSSSLKGVNAKGDRVLFLRSSRGHTSWWLRGSNTTFLKKVTSCSTSEGQASSPYPDSHEPVTWHFSSDPVPFSSSAERPKGKSGFVYFHGYNYQRGVGLQEPPPVTEKSKVVWFLGPTVLVAFLVFPSLYLRRVISAIFEDSLLTDFLILFFTEALFYSGVAIFVLLVDHMWRPVQQSLQRSDFKLKPQFVRLSSAATLILSLIIPLLMMGLVWPWTGPAASAALAPYLAGVVVQFAFEQYSRRSQSPAWPVIPVVFQVYRLHQLNRAAQLVTALTFSVKGAETSSQTFAITRSLGALLIVLQILGVICIWSLSSFVMRFLPSSGFSET